MQHASRIAQELGVTSRQVEATLRLLDEGATVPFISRYRKEVTGSLDDRAVTGIRDRIQQLRDLDARREAILKSIREQEKLTPELEKKIRESLTMTQLEDLYLPYRPKRKTRASVARERGLEPLADRILTQAHFDVELEALQYIDQEKGVSSKEEALQGARDIIAELVNEHPESRQRMRDLFMKKALVTSRVLRGKAKLPEAAKYQDYFEWSEPLNKIPSHRLLAMRRGEKEMILGVSIAPEESDAIAVLEREFLNGNSAASKQVKEAISDGYHRLMKLSIETEVRLATKKKADEEAILVFAENLRQLLLSAPLGQKAVLALDPGFRTGCKVVCLDRQGKLLADTVIYPNEPRRDIQGAAQTIGMLVEKYGIEAIAIGNGTASRETEQFVKGLGLPEKLVVAVVNESGASIYSASEVARAEFPDHDVTVRGAVSIGRRLMDPLAELVKIDAKSIGVGQYQHDVDQNALKQSLDDVVMGCVNHVGVELNTASKELLTYVSGLGPQLAENIIAYRDVHGPFDSRASLKKVTRLGEKAFEQAAGFLRIRNARNPLDRSAVHPERYGTVQVMARDAGCTIDELIADSSRRAEINIHNYVAGDLGLPTLKDIMDELSRPGRDPRDIFEVVTFAEGVHAISDLKTGMQLPGVVTNITKFGAFVDVGVHQDGLVHISQLSDSFVSDPAQVVKLGQKVNVRVTEVDVERKRISLSMKAERPQTSKKKSRQSNQSSEPDGDLQAKLAQLKGKFGN